jgi:selenocysteine lyase/cysteine desulfurase
VSGSFGQLAGLMASTESVREQFARLVNATPDEIGLLFSTVDGENVIANGVALKAGDNVVVDDLHYTTEFVLYRAGGDARH